MAVQLLGRSYHHLATTSLKSCKIVENIHIWLGLGSSEEISI